MSDENRLRLPKLGAVDPSLFPHETTVQPSGACYCPSKKDIGTLGVQVYRSPNTRYLFFATYHNFENQKDFQWLFNRNGKIGHGQKGSVIQNEYDWGPDRSKPPLLDCVVIQLNSTDAGAVKPGIYNVSPEVKGAQSPPVGARVRKYGITTGLTFGKVAPPPSGYAGTIYDQRLFWVEGTDEYGNPNGSAFAAGGDSGATVVIDSKDNGYVAGMVIQVRGNYTVVSRMDWMLRKMQVKLHRNL